jgi:hypothetical protein
MIKFTALQIIQQAAGELGFPRPNVAVSANDTTTIQMVSLLQSAGYELSTYYNWPDLKKRWQFTTTGASEYALPNDWNYFVDQTQWDQTNRWPLMGPKSSQEWAWLKSGIVAQGPRTRYRVQGGALHLHPTPTSPITLYLEYIRNTWVIDKNGVQAASVIYDDDIPQFDAWMLIKFIKLKLWQVKGFDTTAFMDDFLRLFDAQTGKSNGAQILSMSRRVPSMLIGGHNIPDGSWQVTP